MSYPDLYEIASQPYVGLTANVLGRPYLVIAKTVNGHLVEGLDGDRLELETLEWSDANREASALVAASRVEGSPLALGKKFRGIEVGKLAYTEDGWISLTADGQLRVPVEEVAKELAGRKWAKSLLDRYATFSANVQLDDGRDVYLHETHDEGDRIHCEGDDGRRYIVDVNTGNVLLEGAAGNDVPVGQLPYEATDPEYHGYDPDRSYDLDAESSVEEEPFSFEQQHAEAEALIHNVFAPHFFAAAKHTPGTRVELTHPKVKGKKGTIIDQKGTDPFEDDLYVILLDGSGEKMEKVPESAFRRVTAAEEQMDRERNHFTDPKGPLRCTNCGSHSVEPTNLRKDKDSDFRCLSCGETFKHKVQVNSKTATTTFLDSQGQPVTKGRSYLLHSTQWKVPDVIHVLGVDDEQQQIMAAIDGDDKVSFPLSIHSNDIDEAGYTFEPFIEGVDAVTAAFQEELLEENHEQRIARRNFSAQEQRELIEESTDQQARNFGKINVEGTHYTAKWNRLDSEDPLATAFLW